MNRKLAITILTGDAIGTTKQTHEAVKMAIEAWNRRVEDERQE